MAAPEFVPRPAVNDLNAPYESPPWSFDPWLADRPADLGKGQPRAAGYGNQGPDQGYVLKLCRQYEGKLVLGEREHEVDALAGSRGVALKRASIFGRAPVIHDVTIALTIWGYLTEAPDDLLQIRRPLFEEVSNAHHYNEQRRVVDLVPEQSLRLSPAEAAAQHDADWQSLLDLSLLESPR
jgi:hypothetical protein